MSSTVNKRINFATAKNPLEYPDFLDVQLKSFKDFLQLDTPTEKRNIKYLQRTSPSLIQETISYLSFWTII